LGADDKKLRSTLPALQHISTGSSEHEVSVLTSSNTAHKQAAGMVSASTDGFVTVWSTVGNQQQQQEHQAGENRAGTNTSTAHPTHLVSFNILTMTNKGGPVILPTAIPVSSVVSVVVVNEAGEVAASSAVLIVVIMGLEKREKGHGGFAVLLECSRGAAKPLHFQWLPFAPTCAVFQASHTRIICGGAGGGSRKRIKIIKVDLASVQLECAAGKESKRAVVEDIEHAAEETPSPTATVSALVLMPIATTCETAGSQVDGGHEETMELLLSITLAGTVRLHNPDTLELLAQIALAPLAAAPLASVPSEEAPAEAEPAAVEQAALPEFHTLLVGTAAFADEYTPPVPAASGASGLRGRIFACAVSTHPGRSDNKCSTTSQLHYFNILWEADATNSKLAREGDQEAGAADANSDKPDRLALLMGANSKIGIGPHQLAALAHALDFAPLPFGVSKAPVQGLQRVYLSREQRRRKRRKAQGQGDESLRSCCEGALCAAWQADGFRQLQAQHQRPPQQQQRPQQQMDWSWALEFGCECALGYIELSYILNDIRPPSSTAPPAETVLELSLEVTAFRLRPPGECSADAGAALPILQAASNRLYGRRGQLVHVRIPLHASLARKLHVHVQVASNTTIGNFISIQCQLAHMVVSVYGRSGRSSSSSSGGNIASDSSNVLHESKLAWAMLQSPNLRSRLWRLVGTPVPRSHGSSSLRAEALLLLGRYTMAAGRLFDGDQSGAGAAGAAGSGRESNAGPATVAGAYVSESSKLSKLIRHCILESWSEPVAAAAGGVLGMLVLDCRNKVDPAVLARYRANAAQANDGDDHNAEAEQSARGGGGGQRVKPRHATPWSSCLERWRRRSLDCRTRRRQALDCGGCCMHFAGAGLVRRGQPCTAASRCCYSLGTACCMTLCRCIIQSYRRDSPNRAGRCTFHSCSRHPIYSR
jgi:hypothetical protein